MMDDGIDYLAFTGHKDLKALPGVGGLCSIEPLNFTPFVVINYSCNRSG